MKRRHAYCIIAHTDLYCLNKLIQCIDDERNDIFILLDKKCNLKDEEILHPRHSRLFIVPQAHRVNVYWGHVSQIKAELKIFEFAKNHGSYEYFHLLSGQDLPLHNQDYIHQFFCSCRPATNFLGFVPATGNSALENRVWQYIPLIRFYGIKNPKVAYLCDFIRQGAIKLQESLKFHPSRQKLEYRKGCNWASLTDDFITYLLENQKQILSNYRGIRFCDEIYKQTLAWNSGFRNTLYDAADEYNGCLREIDWNRGGPYVYTAADFNILTASEKLFARKFSSSVDKGIIDAIADRIANSPI